jgi:hypothetical protein
MDRRSFVQPQESGSAAGTFVQHGGSYQDTVVQHGDSFAGTFVQHGDGEDACADTVVQHNTSGLGARGMRPAPLDTVREPSRNSAATNHDR